MNASEIRTKSESELQELLAVRHQEQFNMRIQKATGQLTKSHQIKSIRKEIARINTVLAEKRQ